jgi:Tol biopolymer transport system component
MPILILISIVLTLGLGFAPAGAHIGDMVWPTFEITDADLARIDLHDGRVAEWKDVIGAPSLVGSDFFADPTVGDGAPFDPDDMDYRIWLAWHRRTSRLYLAIERTDDVYINEYEGGDLIQTWRHDSIEFYIDGDHSGGEFTGFSDRELSDEERQLLNYQQAQAYPIIGDAPDGRHIGYLGAGADWVNDLPYTDGGGSSQGLAPTTTVIETYITPFDSLVWNAPEVSKISSLYPDKILGFNINMFDFDTEPGAYHAFHTLTGNAGGTWRYAERFADTRLIGAGQELNAYNPNFEERDLSFWSLDDAWSVVGHNFPDKKNRRYATTCGQPRQGEGDCITSTSGTGVLRSDPFLAGARYLTFRLAGFSGPDCERGENLIRLRRAGTDEVLREMQVPCRNRFEEVFWDLRRIRNELVYLEAVDGDGHPEWGWIAVDDFHLTDALPPAKEECPPVERFSISPNIARIAFTSTRGRLSQEGIYTMDADGVHVRPLIDTPCREHQPTRSPDGGSIAFVQQCDSEDPQIHLLDLSTGEQREIYRGDAQRPTWSPDGRYIAFTTSGGYIELIDLSTTELIPFNRDLKAAHLSWYPDSKWLACARTQICAVRIADGYDFYVTQGPDWQEHWKEHPAWSPDSSQLALVQNGDLWLGPVSHWREGDQEAWIMKREETRQVTCGYPHVTSPSWSADGHYIAFAAELDGDSDLFQLEVATGRIRRLTNHMDEDTEPIWLPWDRTTAVEIADHSLPVTLYLQPNAPNPFNARTIIRYSLPEEAHVTLTIYDLQGQKIRELVRQHHSAGTYQTPWDGRDDRGEKAASGIYLYRLETAKSAQTRKMALIQ